jgi:hypothetical protein
MVGARMADAARHRVDAVAAGFHHATAGMSGSMPPDAQTEPFG